MKACFPVISGEGPDGLQPPVILQGQEDVDRIFTGVQSCNKGAKVNFLHGCAPRSRACAAAAPDMEEYGGSRPGKRLGFSIVSNKELQGMRVVVLPHLGLLFPQFPRLVIESKVSVVVSRGWIFDPQVAGGDLVVVRAGPLFYGLLVTPNTSKGEDSCRRTPITFFFNWRGIGCGMETTTPRKALFPAPAFPGAGSLSP